MNLGDIILFQQREICHFFFFLTIKEAGEEPATSLLLIYKRGIIQDRGGGKCRSGRGKTT